MKRIIKRLKVYKKLKNTSLSKKEIFQYIKIVESLQSVELVDTVINSIKFKKLQNRFNYDLINELDKQKTLISLVSQLYFN